MFQVSIENHEEVRVGKYNVDAPCGTVILRPAQIGAGRSGSSRCHLLLL